LRFLGFGEEVSDRLAGFACGFTGSRIFPGSRPARSKGMGLRKRYQIVRQRNLMLANAARIAKRDARRRVLLKRKGLSFFYACMSMLSCVRPLFRPSLPSISALVCCARGFPCPFSHGLPSPCPDVVATFPGGKPSHVDERQDARDADSGARQSRIRKAGNTAQNEQLLLLLQAAEGLAKGLPMKLET